VTEAADGLDAVKALEDAAFDLIVSDLRMPRADGFAVLRKAQEPSVRTPVVILTAARRSPIAWRPCARERSTSWSSRSMPRS